MGLFSKVGQSESSEGGVYIKPGLHKLEVQRAKGGTSRKDGSEFFAMDFKVLESTSSIPGQPAPHAVGSTVGWMAMSKHASAPGNIKALVEALLTPEKLPADGAKCEEAMKLIMGEAQPLTGYVVACEAFNITTGRNNEFTKCKWQLVKKPD